MQRSAALAVFVDAHIDDGLKSASANRPGIARAYYEPPRLQLLAINRGWLDHRLITRE